MGKKRGSKAGGGGGGKEGEQPGKDGDQAAVLSLKMDSSTPEAPREVAESGSFQTPCSISGLGAGVSGGMLGFVWGYGEHRGGLHGVCSSQLVDRLCATLSTQQRPACAAVPRFTCLTNAPMAAAPQAATGSAASRAAASGRRRWERAGPLQRCATRCCWRFIHRGCHVWFLNAGRH